MFYKIHLLLILLIIFYLLIENISKENFSKEKFVINKRTANTSITNFLNNREVPYCPNMHSSKAKFWIKIDGKNTKNEYIKVCCTTCYYKIRKSIECSNNKNGSYKIDKFNRQDIDNLLKYKTDNNLSTKTNKNALEKLIKKTVLKYKFNDIYYPVQMVKYKKDMDYKDLIKKIEIKKKFKCKK